MRQSGRTSEQILNAPAGAMYIWPYQNTIDYCKALAYVLGRADLIITTVAKANALIGIRKHRAQIMIDHACWDMPPQDQLNDRVIHLINYANGSP